MYSYYFLTLTPICQVYCENYPNRFCFSYSRQNLLSTKSNEGLQNLCTAPDGSDTRSSSSNCTERIHYNTLTFPPSAPQSVTVSTITKTNTTNTLHNVSGGLPPLVPICNRPQRVRTMFKMPTSSTHMQNTNLLSNVPPPDVLNVNQIQNTTLKCNDAELVDGNGGGDILQVQLPILNANDHYHNDNDTTTGNSSIMPDSTLSNIYDNIGTCNLIGTNLNQQDHLKNWRRQINRNEWHEEPQDNSTVK